MEGVDGDRGVNHRALADLFSIAAQRSKDVRCEWLEANAAEPSFLFEMGIHLLLLVRLLHPFPLPRYSVSVAMLEVYNENLRDLLLGAPDGSGNKENQKDKDKLEIRQGPEGLWVPGLTELPVASLHDVTRLLSVGGKARATGGTKANAHRYFK